MVAISSRALFDLEESNRIYDEHGLAAYRAYQIAHEDEPLAPGDALPLVQKLLRLNAHFPGRLVEVILLSRNSADTGLRVFQSIEHFALDITRAAFCGGTSPYRYAQAFGCDLFLSAVAEDVEQALQAGIPAATLLPGSGKGGGGEELRIAFDGDAVLFADDAERLYRSEGLDAFTETERQAAREPLAIGPMQPFLAALHRIQSAFPEMKCPLRTALVTARSAPAHERVVRTLRDWDVRLDESLFLGGLDKGKFLQAFGADLFFDDQQGHCESAADYAVAGHVPHGVANE